MTTLQRPLVTGFHKDRADNSPSRKCIYHWDVNSVYDRARRGEGVISDFLGLSP